jgi:hypothetical protein
VARAVSSEPGPAREASGVRAPANRRPPATQDIPCYEWVQRAGAAREASGVRAPANRRPPATQDIPCYERHTKSRRYPGSVDYAHPQKKRKAPPSRGVTRGPKNALRQVSSRNRRAPAQGGKRETYNRPQIRLRPFA